MFMHRDRLMTWRERGKGRRWTGGLLATGVALFSPACAQFEPAAVLSTSPPPRVVRAAEGEAPALPAEAPKVLPISLETVFRLAEEQNTQMSLARARVSEAVTEKEVVANNWLPNVYVGTSYYRHEGGIQEQDGRLIHSSFGALFGGLEVSSRYDIRELTFQRVNAERKVWQQRGELSRISAETLLDAATTYIDLLAARTGEAIATSTFKDLESLLERTEKLAASEPPARADVHRIRAELHNRRAVVRKLREQAAAASAKLAYLLGLDPCVELVPVDQSLLPLELVNVEPPVCELVAQALTQGPGVRELEGLLGLIQESMAQAQGPGRFLPVLELRMAEGGFGAGPGSGLDWDNRWDLGLQARWNLTEFLTAREKRRLACVKLQQAQLAYQDLRGKLTLGVQEARETIVSEREQMHLSQKQIDEAKEAQRLSDERLRNIPGTSASETLLSFQATALARLNYLNSVRAYDKAQVRLLLLLGPGPGAACTVPPPPQLPSPAGSGQ